MKNHRILKIVSTSRLGLCPYLNSQHLPQPHWRQNVTNSSHHLVGYRRVVVPQSFIEVMMVVVVVALVAWEVSRRSLERIELAETLQVKIDDIEYDLILSDFRHHMSL